MRFISGVVSLVTASSKMEPGMGVLGLALQTFEDFAERLRVRCSLLDNTIPRSE
jgi:hypothetical protein